jgi:hypothetical protein
MIAFKEQYVSSAWISASGYVCIEQFEHSIGEKVVVMITPDQFEAIANMVNQSSMFIKVNWNNGAEKAEHDETNS